MNLGPLSKINLHALHAQLWAFRREVEECWPTPNTKDALRFAYCEAAESLDQYLRQNASYKRNRTIGVSNEELLNELADCAMMLLTAIGPKMDTGYFDHLGAPSIDAICTGTARCLEMAEGQITKGKLAILTRVALGVVLMIAEYPNMHLSHRLDGRLNRIRAKHCAGQTDTQTAVVA